MLVLIILVIILLFGGFGYWGNRSSQPWGYGGGFGLGGTILIIVLVCWLLGIIRL
jgi:hypothetical protein